MLTAVYSRPSSAPPVSSSPPVFVSAAAVAAGLTAADPFAPAAVPDGSAPSSVCPDDCSEEVPSLVDSVAASDGSAPRDCLVPVAAVARDSSARETMAGRFVPVAEWGVPALLASVPRDWAPADLTLADSARADTSAVPRAGLTVVLSAAPDDTPESATARGDSPEPVDLTVAGYSVVPRAELPVVSLVAPDDTPDLVKVRVDSPESVDLVVADNSAQWMVVAPTVRAAESAEDGRSPQADSQVARSPLDSPAGLLVRLDDSSPESEWPVSPEALASQLVRQGRFPDASLPTPVEQLARPDAVAESAVVRRTAAVEAVASTSR